MILGRKNQYCKNDYTTKLSLQIQSTDSYSYQIISDIFHRTRIKNFTIHIETQKTLHSQSSLEKELEESIFLTSDYSTKLQSSRQFGTGTKTEV